MIGADVRPDWGPHVNKRRDAAEVLNEKIRVPIELASQRAYVRNVLRREVMLSAHGPVDRTWNVTSPAPST